MTTPFDLSLYLVLDANFCKSPEGMLRTVEAAVAGGCTFVQLRAPEWKKKKILQAARLLKPFLADKGVPLIINDHADVALLSGADGVHVGQDDIDPRDVRRLLGPEAIIGLSVGSPQEFPADESIVDYYGLGPVFSTQTKKDAGSAVGLEELAALCAMTELPTVAIGGINRDNAAACIEAGADGVAVVSAICASPDPDKAAAAILAQVRHARS